MTLILAQTPPAIALIALQVNTKYLVISSSSSLSSPSSQFSFIVGKYSDTTATTQCTDCSPGNYSSSGASMCALCPAGSYSDQYQANTCTPCPAGTYNPSLGSNSSDACISCQPGRVLLLLHPTPIVNLLILT